VLDGRSIGGEAIEAGELLAAVLGQDLEQGDDGRFKIARRVAKDRIISTVDPDARHGHKTSSKGFDGYKGHIAVDPDSEIITATAVTAGNAGDATIAQDLIADLTTTDTLHGDTATDGDGDGDGSAKAKVFGDSAYGTGEFQHHLEEHGIDSGCRTQAPSAPAGRFAKDRFIVDLDADTVSCPNDVTVAIRRARDGSGIAYFAQACAACLLRDSCTNAAGGRTISVSIYEASLAAARQRQQDPAWAGDYRATRPKVERKIGHLMRRRHGGRRARMRGLSRVEADFTLLAAATNLARLAVAGLSTTPNGWATT
jgi:IS5 family transposase